MDDTQIPPFFFAFYESFPRQGPGDESITRAILDDLPELPDNPDIIDMGCGTGSQTLILAERGRVTAVDIHPPFLTLLMHRAQSRGLKERIRPLAASMDALPPGTGPADLIWSEGAVYIIGFENGLSQWWNLVKPGGYVVVSEASLLTRDPPAEAATFWQTEYSRISSVDENCRIIADTGYFCLKTITLPCSAWDEYYAPQVELIRRLREGPLTREEEQILGDIEEEIRIQNRYPDAYGYVFYVMQRPAR